MKRWKHTEHQVAQRLGGQRVPVSGRQRGETPDVEHPHFSIEVKDRQSLPAWLMDAIDQAEKSVRGDKIPVVILHEKGKKQDDNLVLMRLKDLVKLYQEVK